MLEALRIRSRFGAVAQGAQVKDSGDTFAVGNEDLGSLQSVVEQSFDTGPHRTARTDPSSDH